MFGIAKFNHYMSVVRAYVAMFGVVGIGYLIEAWVLRTRRLVKIRPRWSPHPLFVRLATSDIQVFQQIFLAREYGIGDGIAQPVVSIVDAGANIGLTSVFFALRFPEAKIVAIEPEENNFHLLEANCKWFANIKCVRGALWRNSEPVRIQSPDVRDCSFSVEASQEAKSSIPGLSVADVLDQARMDRLSLLKMDIEGAEVEVFGSSANWIDRVDNIIVELHDRKRRGCTEAFRAATAAFEIRAETRELTLAVRR